jgi:hypothetical protein
MNSQTVEEQVWDEEQQEYKSRFVNKSRVSGWAVPVIGHNHQVPTEPEAPIRERIPKLDARLYGRLIEVSGTEIVQQQLTRSSWNNVPCGRGMRFWRSSPTQTVMRLRGGLPYVATF